jgi:ParB family transcriptional regulator, chromosome partitioning protein
MTEDTPQKRRPSGLGRGLSALLGEIQVEAPVAGDGTGGALPQGLRMVDVAGLRPMPNQPRRTFDDGALDELADSIRSRGLLQPIIVRESTGEGHYQIIAGERRWRAAQRAQLHQVPVIIKDFDDKTAYELAIIENIQREQLNAWEEGEGYRRLVDDYGYTQETLAKIVGKSRSHIANLMRLHNLPLSVHGWLAAGELTMGHARALLSTEDPEGTARLVMAKGLSVRQTEALVRKGTKPKTSRQRLTGDVASNADIAALERQLSDLLGLKIAIRHTGKEGSVTLAYSSLEQLDLICQRLSGERI